MDPHKLQNLGGWLNSNKPLGMSSHDVVDCIRASLRPHFRTRVGHIGTLDPTASGVLPICLGRATRLARFTEDFVKTYTFEVTFGVETETLDTEGRVVSRQPVSLSESEIAALLPRFTGEITQTPPKFSAVHINGARAYSLAKKGRDFEIPSRQVVVHSLELLRLTSGDYPQALLKTTVSKGTYIRSLAADLGRALGCGAHLSALVRNAVGLFLLENAASVEDCREASGLISRLLPPDWPLEHLPGLALDEAQSALFAQGTRLEGIALDEEKYFRIYRYGDNETREFIGIGRREESSLRPEVVIKPHGRNDASGNDKVG